MEQLKISQLKAGAPLAQPLFHSSGETLLGAGRIVTSDVLRMIEEAGIEEVLRPEPGEDPGEFVHDAKNLVMSVSELNVGQRMTQPVFDGSGALLVEAGSVVSERMATGLRRRGVERIYVRKSTKELGLGKVQAFRRALRRMTASRPESIREEIDASRRIKPEDCTARTIDQMIDAVGEIAVPRGRNALLQEMKTQDPLAAREQVSKDGFLVMYEETVGSASKMLRTFENNREVDEAEIGARTRAMVGGLIEDRDLLLNLSTLKTDYNYLVGHSLGTTVLSIAVAAAAGYSQKMVLELGYAAYLHDIGMLRVPKEVIGKSGKLTGAEMRQVQRHPFHGLDMLQRLVGRRSGLAGTIPIVAYQSHERENGSGYPKGRKGRVIHDFAKMLSVCDAYEAMTSRRPWREAMLPYKAMEQLVLLAARKVFSPEMVKALLRCLSLFPIGSWVELSDQSVARVVAGSEHDYTRPVVSVVFRKGERIAEPQRISLAEETDVTVVRPIPAPEDGQDLMEGF